MNKKTYLAIMLAAPLATACVNSDYDLNDVNTEVEVPVNDLIVPIELKSFSLNSVIDIEDNDKIKEVNGEYAVVVDGDFKSDEINVDPIKTAAPEIDDITGKMQKKHPSELNASSAKRVMNRANDLGAPIAYYTIPSDFKPVVVTTDDLSEAIKKLKGAKIDTNLEVTINLDKTQKLKDYVSGLHLKDLKFQVPKGIDGEFSITNEAGAVFQPYNYDKTTGVVQFQRVDLTMSGKVTLRAHITGLDENALDKALHEIEGKAGKELTINAEYGVVSGYLAVYESDQKGAASSRRRAASSEDFYNQLPENLEYLSTAKMDEVTVTSFSGEIDYDVDDFAMDNVSLTDVPDLLQQSGTNIGLSNPQIYVHINNPMADGEGKVLKASAKIDLYATMEDGEVKAYKMNLDSQIDADKEDNYFVLSPRQPEKMYAGYEAATWVPFEMLADLLRSNGDVTTTLDDVAKGGIPKSIDIKVSDAHVRSKNVVNYELGQNYKIHGDYLFYAPLEMSENSSIRYEETVDGWTEDLQDVNVARLNVQAKVSTDVPFELQFRIKPIKADGTAFNGQYSIATVPAKAKNAVIALNIEGADFTGIDGIRIEALALSKEQGALRPDMNISISDLKVQVSGSYKGKF